jgi:DNA polymerase-3 subunit delta'
VEVVREALRERWGATAEQAELLAHLSGGRLGWAVRMLEDEEALQRRARRLDEVNALIGGSIVERFRYVERLAQDPVATQETLDLWIGWWRDVLLVASDADASLTNVDRQDEVRDHARRFGVATSAAFVRALRSAVQKLGQNANVRLTLDVLMLELPLT